MPNIAVIGPRAIDGTVPELCMPISSRGDGAKSTLATALLLASAINMALRRRSVG
jgi:hypothetical protein